MGEKHETSLQRHSGQPMSRRETLRLGIAGGASLVFGGLRNAYGGPAKPTTTAKAKLVIQVWLWGGPSHLDSFDPKPEAGPAYCGPLDKPIPTNVDGIMIGQLFPELAKQADKYSLIRSMTHGINAHETAAYMVQTGWELGDGDTHPSIGSVASFFRGYRAGYRNPIPPFVVVTESQGRFSEAGFLGSRYRPFATGGDPRRDPFVVEGIVAQGISTQRQRDRRDLLNRLNVLPKAMPGNPEFAALQQCDQQAYDLILGDAGKVFDLTQETQEMREFYGFTRFGAGLTKIGQSCLLARRLVEKGVPYVTINDGGWDHHKAIFSEQEGGLPDKATALDRALAALLQDLSDRGLLESTIVWCGGEFGGTPKVSTEPPWTGGRQHWGNVFSALVAGGGFQGGQVVGSSDEKGEEVKERPVYPVDLLGSMYDLLGIDTNTKLPHPQGKEVAVLPTAADGVNAGGRLTEIMPVA